MPQVTKSVTPNPYLGGVSGNRIDQPGAPKVLTGPMECGGRL